MYTEDDIQKRLDEVRKAHPKARHHCYAWRLGLDGNAFRANDDGEPSGTAGRPILGQIDSFELANVLVVVVRYFGGTLLGTSGLIRSYREATVDALKRARIVKRRLEDLYLLEFHYALMSPVMRAVKSQDLEMVEQDFGEVPRLTIAIRQSEVKNGLHRLKAEVAGLRESELEEGADVDELTITYLRTR